MAQIEQNKQTKLASTQKVLNLINYLRSNCPWCICADFMELLQYVKYDGLIRYVVTTEEFVDCSKFAALCENANDKCFEYIFSAEEMENVDEEEWFKGNYYRDGQRYIIRRQSFLRKYLSNHGIKVLYDGELPFIIVLKLFNYSIVSDLFSVIFANSSDHAYKVINDLLLMIQPHPNNLDVIKRDDRQLSPEFRILRDKLHKLSNIKPCDPDNSNKFGTLTPNTRKTRANHWSFMSPGTRSQGGGFGNYGSQSERVIKKPKLRGLTTKEKGQKSITKQLKERKARHSNDLSINGGKNSRITNSSDTSIHTTNTTNKTSLLSRNSSVSTNLLYNQRNDMMALEEAKFDSILQNPELSRYINKVGVEDGDSSEVLLEKIEAYKEQESEGH